MTSNSKTQSSTREITAQPAPKPVEPLRVLLIDDDPDRAQLVEQGLSESSVVHTASEVRGQALLNLVADIRPDVIIMDCFSPDRDSIESLRTVVQNNPKPIVMFVEKENPEGFQQAIDAGVSAYVVDGLTPKRIKPVIDVAIARFKMVDGLRSELKKTKEDLAARKVIAKAKGLLMEKREMTEDEAYSSMRKMSQERAIPLKDVAENILAIFSIIDN